MNSSKKFLLLILGSVVLGSTIIFFGSLVSLGSAFGRIHPALEFILYAIIVAVFALFFLLPIFRILSHPEIPMDAVKEENSDRKLLLKIAENLIATAPVADKVKTGNDAATAPESTASTAPAPEAHALIAALDSDSDLLRDSIREELERRQSLIGKLFIRNSALAFTSTAISQSKAIDSLLILGINSRMILEIVKLSGCRPTLPQLIKLYAVVGAAAFTIEGWEDINLTGINIDLPFVKSATQGIGAAAFTIFIAYLTNHYIQTGFRRLDRKERRKLRLEALKQLPKVVTLASKHTANSLLQGMNTAARNLFGKKEKAEAK